MKKKGRTGCDAQGGWGRECDKMAHKCIKDVEPFYSHYPRIIADEALANDHSEVLL